MNKYHMTTKIALVLDGLILLDFIVQGAGAAILPVILGTAALFFAATGQIRQNTRLGIVLVTVNVVFSLWLSVLAQNASNSILQPFYITIPVMLLFLAVQLVLCFKASRLKIKQAPACVVIILSFFFGLLGTMAFVTEDFYAMMIILSLGAYIAMPGLIGTAAGWIVYKLCERGNFH